VTIGGNGPVNDAGLAAALAVFDLSADRRAGAFTAAGAVFFAAFAAGRAAGAAFLVVLDAWRAAGASFFVVFWVWRVAIEQNLVFRALN
jgi:hypothetical protein